MSRSLLHLLTSEDPSVRDIALESWCRDAPTPTLLEEADRLDRFRRECDNLYLRVRALFFLSAIHRYVLPHRLGESRASLSFDGYQHLLQRRFEEAIDTFLRAQREDGPSGALSSALALAYRDLGFQALADQVRRSVRTLPGNRWMFRMGHPADHPLRIRPELLNRTPDGRFPLLMERTPVRMDLTHSAWSDIFFLGMDAPEAARVLNVSVDLAVWGRDPVPKPPIDTYLRVIDEPVLRLVSIDLDAHADLRSLADVFDFGKDYLGLIKAAVIAAGIVPPGLEGSEEELGEALERVVGPGLGLEIVSHVHDIPKGSRLAVSTNLLGSLIALCMRATSQARSLTGSLSEGERRTVAARAILGEWLGGSGGGWQDSGGIWPGIKRIEGVTAQEDDPEHGVSRGRLLPRHTLFGEDRIPSQARRNLQESLVLVHGGMAQNVGPILEMVTEKYLLRSEREWEARKETLALFDRIEEALRAGDIAALGRATTRNFFGPLQTIIPWAGNYYTETLIRAVREAFGTDFWGYWMMGGMSGGGMGFMFAPEKKPAAQAFLQETMRAVRRELQHALPFAMEPVVYDFRINERGTDAEWISNDSSGGANGASNGERLLPAAYYALMVPRWLRKDARDLSPMVRAEMDRLGAASRTRPELMSLTSQLFERFFPHVEAAEASSLDRTLGELGFDPEQHEAIRADLKHGRIGLAQNRLPANIRVRDVEPGDVIDTVGGSLADCESLGRDALRDGAVGVLTLAAGAGSRWTQGAGTVKALHPFCKLSGRYRTFIETHLAKSRRRGRECGTAPVHLFATSYATHEPIARYLAAQQHGGYSGPLHLSPGRAVGLRLVPTVQDLNFLWNEQPQKLLDEQAQKVRENQRAAMIAWARREGEAADYTDNLPLQRMHPLGHWYEVSNLLRNGVLERLLSERPQLRYLLLHNIDTLGVDLDPGLLGLHIRRGSGLSFEVIPRHIEDRGGGLARVNGQVRIVEGLALPREADEFELSCYNSMTTWISIDPLLALFELERSDLGDAEKVSRSIRRLSARVPTYITLKEVKKRWGHGQEDVYLVSQWEKLWSDVTLLPEASCSYFQVSRFRGQQLKEQAQLDAWLRDGSAAYVEALCDWDDST